MSLSNEITDCFVFRMGQRYMPILPMVLVNGAEGIGTGWSTSIPNYSPRDIVANLTALLDGQTTSPMKPWYKVLGSVPVCTHWIEIVQRPAGLKLIRPLRPDVGSSYTARNWQKALNSSAAGRLNDWYDLIAQCCANHSELRRTASAQSRFAAFVFEQQTLLGKRESQRSTFDHTHLYNPMLSGNWCSCCFLEHEQANDLLNASCFPGVSGLRWAWLTAQGFNGTIHQIDSKTAGKSYVCSGQVFQASRNIGPIEHFCNPLDRIVGVMRLSLPHLG